ncbi:gamma-glutamylcyclotransferase [Haloarchaeobius amylolyticus]|uniref:Gamma-glutamylcyclotransferase n=1 Tax=Haloarchaeobius amylolyticus TaxID=1198296 RepID=A0ABD6BFI8_9EURY
MAVFVYGTLTDPERAATVLGDGLQYEFVGRATLEGLHRVDGRYPTLAPGGSVDGRLLAVDDAGLERLDRYEGIESGLYVRVAVPATSGVRDDRCWVYVGEPDRLDVDGTWPGSGPFRDCVQRVVSRRAVVVRRTE